MKRSILAALSALTLVASLSACSNLNRQTPKSLDNTAMESEIRKNLASDSITGLQIDVHEGVVTLTGHLSAADKAKAMADAQKVNGVTQVIDRISVP